MSRVAEKRRTRTSRQIEALLKEHGYENSDAYQLPRAASVRVRVIDDRFRAKSRVEREKMVLPIIRKLPDEVLSDITVLLLITPDEQETSLMNLEFERPLEPQL